MQGYEVLKSVAAALEDKSTGNKTKLLQQLSRSSTLLLRLTVLYCLIVEVLGVKY